MSPGDSIAQSIESDTISPGNPSKFDMDMIQKGIPGQKDVPELSSRRERGGANSETSKPAGGLEYGAKDRNQTDIIEQKIHLYGEAFVTYDDFTINAEYIIFDLKTNEVKASSGDNSSERATFKNGSQVVSADSLRFNIDTEQGIVYGARIQQDQFYIHGATTKFVRAGKDSLHIDDVVYNKNALLTTCDLDHPHWGIRTTKLKLIPDKLAVVGPFDMELAGIPTPLALPFAFAPLFSFGKSTSGLIFPQDPFYTSPRLGIGMRGLGYYFALSDKMDLQLTGDIYTRGTFALNAVTNYKKRYKYSGRIDVRYSRELQDLETATMPNIQKAYSFGITHNQDRKAHPYRTIGGSLRFTINDFDRRNYADANSQLNSQINSNFSYAYRLSSKTNFSTSIQHSQNTSTRAISFTLPEMQIRMSRIFPFKRQGSSASNEKWYEKINVQYNGKFQNKVSTVDTLLFTSETLDKFRSGVSHEMDIGASYKLLEHFSFNTSASYDEFWYFQTYRHTEADSLGNVIAGEVVPDFKPLRDMRASANLTTNIFGTVQFAKGWLRGLRHQMTPSFGISYSPSNEGYYEYFDIDPDVQVDEEVRYNPFRAEEGETLVFNRSLNPGGMSFTYGLSNTLEGKRWSKKDSTEKKFKIFNQINFSGSHNFQADSLKWSTVRVTANANLFKGKTRVSISGALDPYVRNEDGVRVNRTVLSEQGKLLRWDEFTAGISTNISLREISDLLKGNLQDENQGSTGRTRSRAAKRSGSSEPELFSWFENFKISHELRMTMSSRTEGLETTAHSIRLTTGNIPLSDKWGMSVGNLSYDLKRKRWVYPSFTLTRQLHCWNMRISWQPQLDTYTFFIGVTASPFGDYIKYQTGRANFDGANQFRF